MKLTVWTFKDLSMPMMEDDRGILYCTTKVLCDGLYLSEEAVKKIYSRHSDEFGCLTVTNSPYKDFMVQNKDVFGMKRIRDNMRMWTESDMLMFAILSKSGVSKDFRRQLIQFIKENARRGYVTQDVYQRTMARLDNVERALMAAGFALGQNASSAGALLNQQKKSKAVRNTILGAIPETNIN